MTGLNITILSPSEVTPNLRARMDELDHLAFEADKDDPLLAGIEWAPSQDWYVLGVVDGVLVSELGLLTREICVGEEKIWVVGVGGVATHPLRQRQGYATALLRAAEVHMREKMHESFGLLVCSEETRPFYEGVGWRHAADELYYEQNGERRLMRCCVMILPIMGREWLSGKIDLCGLPW